MAPAPARTGFDSNAPRPHFKGERIIAHTLQVGDKARRLAVAADLVDLRDTLYRPSLAPLRKVLVPNRANLNIRDQHDSPACTGFALAAVIDQGCRQMFGDDNPPRVSARMLYEMARLHDELPDSVQPGATLRGCLKGFFHNGVFALTEELQKTEFPPIDAPLWRLTTDLVRLAREISLGAYFRLDHIVNDYHSAIHEAGALVVSARICDGWIKPKEGVIGSGGQTRGHHAFAVVGYDQMGFLIQNSWGPHWGGYGGLPGVALWRYEDWFDTVEDAWVLRLAVPSPSAFAYRFARSHTAVGNGSGPASASPPRRQEILDHYLHLDDGALVQSGRYAQPPDSVDEIGLRLEGAQREKCREPYGHLLILAHGAMTDRVAVARRIRAWGGVFEAAGIYPVHVMWETAFNSDIVDVMSDLLLKTEKRMGTDAAYTDARLEALARPLGRKLWRDLKTSAALTFGAGSEGGAAVRALIANAVKRPSMQIHFAGFSAGALLLGGVAEAAKTEGQILSSVSLMAPACGLDSYDAGIRPHVGRTIRKLNQYVLSDRRERADRFGIYGRSLLCLVSDALESAAGAPMLGLARDLGRMAATGRAPLPAAHRIFEAGRDRENTDSRSHTGFDRDRTTMNDILATILGRRPGRSEDFSLPDLAGY